MTLLHEALEAKKFDSRTVERAIQKGVLKQEDHDKAVQQLKDDADNAEWTNLETLALDSSDN